MPIASPKPCCVCRVLVTDGSERCPAHKREAWTKYSTAGTKRRTGRALQRDRAALFAREPLCRICHRLGRVTLAVIRDHIQPLAEGGPDVDANVQPLCQACSDAKTASESKRGQYGPRGVGEKFAAAPPETAALGTFSRAGVSGGGGTR